MELRRGTTRVTIELDGEEVELLKLALRRATFEDTPPERQREILEFAAETLRALGGD